jgi:hypothetical protein
MTGGHRWPQVAHLIINYHVMMMKLILQKVNLKYGKSNTFSETEKDREQLALSHFS